MWDIYPPNSIYSILQGAGPSNSPLLLGGPHPVGNPLMWNISKRAQGHLLDGMLNSLETHSPFPDGAGVGHSTIAAPFLHPCVSLQFLSLSWVFRGRSASLMPGVWDAHLFLPCGRHIQALQMSIWGVPLFEVREGKAIPVLPLGEWQCHLTTSTVLPMRLATLKIQDFLCQLPLPPPLPFILGVARGSWLEVLPPPRKPQRELSDSPLPKK